MGRDRRVRRPEAAEAGEQPARAAEHTPDRIAAVLALQATVGNAAVARMLAAPQVMRAGWSGSESGGFNEKERTVQGTLRIPIQGLSVGNQSAAAAPKQTNEVAGAKDSGRAIVIVPSGTDFAGGKLEVLLHFHGHNIGYRQRSVDEKDGVGKAGEVRDVAIDDIPEQLVDSGRNTIAVLPQGTLKSGFDTGPTQAYVTEVLAKLRPELVKLLPGVNLPATLDAYRVIASGHSGGGPAATAAAQALQGGDWHRSAPLLLFDAINGTAELSTVKGVLAGWLKADLAHLKSAADPDAELDKRGLRFRTTFSSGGTVYTAMNVGGTYKQGIYEQGKKVGEKEISVSAGDSVRGFLDAWFARQGKGPLAAHVPKWKEQYRVEAVASRHDEALGTESDAKTNPGSKVVPGYKAGSGNLEKSLQGLPKDAMRPAGGGAPAPPAKTGLLELSPVAEGDDEFAYV